MPKRRLSETEIDPSAGTKKHKNNDTSSTKPSEYNKLKEVMKEIPGASLEEIRVSFNKETGEEIRDFENYVRKHLKTRIPLIRKEILDEQLKEYRLLFDEKKFHEVENWSAADVLERINKLKKIFPNKHSNMVPLFLMHAYLLKMIEQKDDEEIAKALGFSVKTLETHFRNIKKMYTQDKVDHFFSLRDFSIVQGYDIFKDFYLKDRSAYKIENLAKIKPPQKMSADDRLRDIIKNIKENPRRNSKEFTDSYKKSSELSDIEIHGFLSSNNVTYDGLKFNIKQDYIEKYKAAHKNDKDISDVKKEEVEYLINSLRALSIDKTALSSIPLAIMHAYIFSLSCFREEFLKDKKSFCENLKDKKFQKRIKSSLCDGLKVNPRTIDKYFERFERKEDINLYALITMDLNNPGKDYEELYWQDNSKIVEGNGETKSLSRTRYVGLFLNQPQEMIANSENTDNEPVNLHKLFKEAGLSSDSEEEAEPIFLLPDDPFFTELVLENPDALPPLELQSHISSYSNIMNKLNDSNDMASLNEPEREKEAEKYMKSVKTNGVVAKEQPEENTDLDYSPH